MKRTLWLVLLCLVFVSRTLAQDDCPAIVDAALTSASEACSALARNQACYGNVQLQAEAQPDADAFTFEQTGDIVNLSDVASLHLSPMDTDAASWGVALLLTQANLPDTLPGQNVAMVLFGQVDITDAPPIEEPADANSETPTYTPMQAFYFGSSIGDSSCAEAPDSGILIQTPAGVGLINLLINEVEIKLGSTAYLQAGDGEMTVSVIEGQGMISAFGTSVSVPAGTRARIPLDTNGIASGVPIGPEAYDATALSALPLALLPQQIAIAAPLEVSAATLEQIALVSEVFDSLATGDWLYSGEFDAVVCSSSRWNFAADSGTYSMTHDSENGFIYLSVADESALTFQEDNVYFVMTRVVRTLNSPSTDFYDERKQVELSYNDGILHYDVSSSIHFEFTIESPTSISGSTTWTIGQVEHSDGTVEYCTGHVSFTMTADQ